MKGHSRLWLFSKGLSEEHSITSRTYWAIQYNWKPYFYYFYTHERQSKTGSFPVLILIQKFGRGFRTIIIIGDVWNTEYDSLCPQHSQMADSEVGTLVCPFCIYGLDKVFMLVFFDWCIFFPMRNNQNGKGCSPNISNERHSAFAEF